MERGSRSKAKALVVLSVALAIVALSATFVLASHDFPDVPNSAFYHSHVSWAVDNGIAAGFPDGTYKPNSAVTRGQMAVFLKNTAAVTVGAGYHLVGGAISEWFNNVNGLAPTISSCSADNCTVDVKFSTANRFIACTIDTNAVATRDAICTASVPSGNLARVRAWDISAAAFTSDTTDFWVLIYGNEI